MAVVLNLTGGIASFTILTLMRWTIRRILLLFFLVLVLITTALTGGFFYSVINTIHETSFSAIKNHCLDETLDTIGMYLNQAMLSTAVTASIIDQEILYMDNKIGVFNMLWKISGDFPGIGTLAWADDKGNYIGVNKQESYIVYTDTNLGSVDLVRRTAKPGDWLAGEEFRRIPRYDPRLRNWYIQAEQAKSSEWTSIDFSASAQRLDATYVKTIENGVIMTDISLNILSGKLEFLSSFLEAIVVLLDEDEYVVASSDGELPFMYDNGALKRKTLDDFLEGSPAKLLSNLELLPQVAEVDSFITKNITLGDLGQYSVTATVLSHSGIIEGLPSWNILIGLPYTYYSQQLMSALFYLILIIILIVLVCSAALVFFSKWLLQPLYKMQEFGEAVLLGKVAATSLSNRKDEIGRLSNTMQMIHEQLRDMMQKLEASNAEKDILLKEVHHRVKNNLQIITSIINLEKNKLAEEDELAQDIMKNISGRIETMVKVHESLYDSEGMSRIEISSFIPELISSIVQIQCRQEQKISFEYNLDRLELEADIVIPLGLLINEAITNSIKYAFADCQNGLIRIDGSLENDTYILNICDNGCGFDEKILEHHKGLGMMLIDALSKQLHAKMELIQANGFSLRLQLKLDTHKKNN